MNEFAAQFSEFALKQIDQYISEIADMCGNKSTDARNKLRALVKLGEMKGAADFSTSISKKINELNTEDEQYGNKTTDRSPESNQSKS